MFKLFIDWYRRCFSDPNAVALAVVLILLFITLYFFHSILSPLLIAIVLSYLLEKPILMLTNRGISRTFAVLIVLLLFIAIVLLSMAFLVPLIWQQVVGLVSNLPTMLTSLNSFLSTLPERYPELLSVDLFDAIINSLKSRLAQTSNTIVQFSIASLLSFISVIVNAVLVPIIMFFLLKDKKMIMDYCLRFLPQNRKLMRKVANEMNQQISNYIVGTFLQVLILSIMLYIPFWFFGLDYALLLAIMVGLAVIIPYIGIIIATIPIILIALFQFGVSPEFGYLMACYFMIQLIDGNIVVPVLFSEALDLHPIVIILAIIIFGGLWGFWGIFFSIPLATLVKAIINVWPIKGAASPKAAD
ncbi:AI-2E family transporter [Utexia brackfieldae]|uniref:AI-2E family transporter n=1 Tax=Utexia brackfieldae TaxID=3074108 RepID=UPI00370DC1C9